LDLGDLGAGVYVIEVLDSRLRGNDESGGGNDEIVKRGVFVLVDN